MSYTNLVGGSPQPLDTTSSAAVSKTDAAAKTSVGGASANSGAALDHASVSSAGILLAQALYGSDVRSDKVAALQQSIAAGTYSVSSADVADKLVGSLLQ